MNAERLVQYFDRLSEGPDAIPRLRRFILDLAVCGKLVQQDPNDEPASELLKRIEAEKVQLVRKGKLRKAVTPFLAQGGEAPFHIPPGWIWVRLGEIANVVMGQSPPGETYNATGQGVPLINGPVEFSAGAFGKTLVTQYTTAPTNFCEKGDLLICVRGSTTGRTNVAAFHACIGRGVAAIQSLFDDEFVRLFVWSLRDSIIEMGRGIAFPSISRNQIEGLPIPLPPLAEQHRIVAKVDELMALCDELEAAKTEREQSRDRLVAASLHRLNSPADTAENCVPDLLVDQADTFRDHARFVFKHLPRLTTRLEHIKQLRQTILNLAVRGKLVSQDPNDEPAAELLKRIETEKIQLIEQGTIKRQLPVVPLKVDEFLSGVPDSWKWVRLRDLLLHDSQNGYSKKPDDALNGIPILRISAGTLRKDGIVAEEEHKLIGGVSASQQKQYQLQPGDLLACRFNGNRGFVGHLSLYTGYLGIKPIYPDKLIRLRLLSPFVLPKLVMYFAESNDVRKDIESYCATTVGNWGISASNLKEVKIPLPPLAEQHRIVAKVDELMALCDQLEAQLTAAEANGRRLLEAVLHEALNPLAEVAAQLEPVADRVNAPQN
jgi:type I restriction enzyme, S subunit